MTVHTPVMMTKAAFLAWIDQREERYEWAGGPRHHDGTGQKKSLARDDQSYGRPQGAVSAGTV